MLVSICIPCYKRIQHVRNTLKSIYIDNSDVLVSEYEVVITDNDPDMEIKTVVEEFSSYPNLKYIPTQCEGFMNSYHALLNGSGDLLKLHNSQNKICKGMLARIVEQASQYIKEKPLIFHTNGFLNNFNLYEYKVFDIFMSNLSYWSSWSGGMTIWKDDFEKIGKIDINPLFPHTSVFITQYYKSKFVIDDRIFYEIQRVERRGDHNKFEAFTVHFPSLIFKCNTDGVISNICKDKIFQALYVDYIPTLLFNKYIARIEAFDAYGFRKNCQKYFPKGAFWISWLNVPLVPLRMLKRRILHSIGRRES